MIFHLNRLLHNELAGFVLWIMIGLFLTLYIWINIPVISIWPRNRGTNFFDRIISGMKMMMAGRTAEMQGYYAVTGTDAATAGAVIQFNPN